MKRTAAYALAIVLIASQAMAQTSQIPSTLDALIAAAKNEGTLDLVWSESLMGSSDAVQKHEAAFNKMFGTSITFKFAPGPEVARLGNQLLTEMQAGQPASSDVYIGAAAQTEPLLQSDLFQSVPWHALSPDRIHEGDIEQDGKALRVQTALSGVTYNTGLIKTPPMKLTDFLDPQWKGKLASTPYAAGFDILAANDFWGPEKTIDFVRKLSSQVAGLIRCGDIERIATGEYSALVMDCLSNTEIEWQERGAPVGYAIMADAAQKRYYYVSISKNAPHPNAAALFSVYLLSKVGQQVIWETMHTDLDSLEGSQTAKTIAEYEKKGVQFPEITIDWWSQHPEINQAKDEMIKALSRK
jgi:ABC-type Fe3+ transport system substrate-binding protein